MRSDKPEHEMPREPADRAAELAARLARLGAAHPSSDAAASEGDTPGRAGREAAQPDPPATADRWWREPDPPGRSADAQASHPPWPERWTDRRQLQPGRPAAHDGPDAPDEQLPGQRGEPGARDGPPGERDQGPDAQERQAEADDQQADAEDQDTGNPSASDGQQRGGRGGTDLRSPGGNAAYRPWFAADSGLDPWFLAGPDGLASGPDQDATTPGG